jgi:hypothetical protein
MATFSDDFSGYSAGDIVTVSGGVWTTQGTLTGWTRQVETDAGAIGGKRLNVQDDAQDWGSQLSCIVNDTIGAQTGDIEVLVAFRITTVANITADSPPIGVVLVTNTQASYGLVFHSATSLSLAEFSGITYNEQIAGPFAITALSNGALHWARLGRNSTTIRCKVWKDGESEPGSWQSGTDATLSSVKAGVPAYDFNAGPFITEWVGIGTGADAAPSPAGDSGPIGAITVFFRMMQGNN